LTRPRIANREPALSGVERGLSSADPQIGRLQLAKSKNWEKIPSSLEASKKLNKNNVMPFLDDENAKWLGRLPDSVLQNITAALRRQRPQRERIASPKSKR